MTQAGFAFETADALAIVGIDRKRWDNIMSRQIYEGVSSFKPGRPRSFSRDEMVCLFIFDHYSRESNSVMAGRVATAVGKELLRGGESLTKLWVVRAKAGDPSYVVHRERPLDMFSHEIDVAKARAVIEQFAVDRLGWKRSEA